MIQALIFGSQKEDDEWFTKAASSCGEPLTFATVEKAWNTIKDKRRRKMDIRISPFGEHPDGGKISELKENEPVPNYVMPLDSASMKILDKIPQQERVDYVLHSTEPELKSAKAWLENRLEEIRRVDFTRIQKALEKADE